jgi:predicted dehydrogenase
VNAPSRLRVGVVGCGAVAQAMHLPYLGAMRDRFEVGALVDPSQAVLQALAARYGVRETYSSVESLLDAAIRLDALVIASPNATHAEIVEAALRSGLHVLVEKPLCITLEAADAIIAARDRAGTVVQVGYMNRFDPAVERLSDELPPTSAQLRYVSVVVQDPEMGPYFAPGDIVRGDIPQELANSLQEAERTQVRAAVGTAAPDAVTALSDGFLGSLVHQVNLIHGLLELMGEPLPATVIDGDSWAGGEAISGSLRLANGARWDNTRIQLLGVPEYRERVALFFEDSVLSLTFPSPWLRQSPTRYERLEAQSGASVRQLYRAHDESFQRQLLHFHDCITSGVECRTPPDQARLDMEVLIAMFRAIEGVAPKAAERHKPAKHEVVR